MCHVAWWNQIFLAAIAVIIVDSHEWIVHDIVNKIYYSYILIGETRIVLIDIKIY